MVELMPPTSVGMVAVAVRPMKASSARSAVTGSVAGGHFFQENRRGAHHGGRNDEVVVAEFLGIEDADSLARPQLLLDDQPADMGVAAATGTKKGGAAAEIADVFFEEVHRVPPIGLQRRRKAGRRPP